MTPHGSASTYTNYGCRCDLCRAANAAAVAKRKRQRYAYVQEHGLPSSVTHGLSAYGNWGCRCPVCRGAWVTYARGRRVQ